MSNPLLAPVRPTPTLASSRPTVQERLSISDGIVDRIVGAAAPEPSAAETVMMAAQDPDDAARRFDVDVDLDLAETHRRPRSPNSRVMFPAIEARLPLPAPAPTPLCVPRAPRTRSAEQPTVRGKLALGSIPPANDTSRPSTQIILDPRVQRIAPIGVSRSSRDLRTRERRIAWIYLALIVVVPLLAPIAWVHGEEQVGRFDDALFRSERVMGAVLTLAAVAMLACATTMLLVR